MTGDGTWTGMARAKVNLRLRVLARGPSGYHRIDTVFQAIELSDRVSIERTEGPDVSIHVTGVAEGELGSSERNLAVRAAKLFLDAAQNSSPLSGVRIVLHKEIPHGAGLGGGSSDAAAVLRGMNELSGRVLGPDSLSALGAEIGADVPFFVSNQSRARGTGRGDRITPLPALPRRPVVLALPSEPVPTAWAYGALVAARAEHGARPGNPVPSRAGIPEAPATAADGWPAAISRSGNDFEDVLFPLRPELRLIRDALRAAGAELAMLSGSGSAVFGVFGSDAAAAHADEVLRAEASKAWARTIRTVTAG